MSRSIRISLRLVCALTLLLWGWFALASLRTQSFGFSPRILLEYFLIGVLFILPLSFLPFLGFSWKRVLLGMASIVLASALLTEIWASTEEHLLLRGYGPDPHQYASLHINRLKPFAHHEIYYSPQVGWYATD